MPSIILCFLCWLWIGGVTWKIKSLFQSDQFVTTGWAFAAVYCMPTEELGVVDISGLLGCDTAPWSSTVYPIVCRIFSPLP
jgi:hypothetical protein